MFELLRRALILSLVLCAAGCGGTAEEERSELVVPTPELVDEARSRAERLERMRSLVATDLSEADRAALLLVMKDKSQQAFIMVIDDSELGWTVAESPYGGLDRRAELRWTAIEAIERLGMREALPDLIGALSDRHPVVRNVAAKALFWFGSAAGLDLLLKGLEGKALENESAADALREMSGKNFGFSPDIGWTRKKKAIDSWRAYVHQELRAQAVLPKKGDDARLDRRMAFYVDLLGQHQFLFMEQGRRALGSLGDLAAAHLADRLSGASPSGNAQLRAYGVQSLEKIATPVARSLLRERLRQDDDGAARSRSAEALGVLKDHDALEDLMAATEDRDDSVVVAAARALGRIGDAKAGARLESLVGSEALSDRLRNTAAIARLRMGEHRASAQRIRQRLEVGPLHERTDLAEYLEEWQGELRGYDAQRPGTEQAEALKAWGLALGLN